MLYEKYDNLMSILRARRSCRDFSATPVSDEVIYMIAEAGRWTPSGHNAQNSCIVRVSDPGMKKAIRAHTNEIMGFATCGPFDPFYGAPELLLVLNADERADMALLDGSMTVYNMLLAASELGLGSCWVNTAQYEQKRSDSILARICVNIGFPNAYGIGYIALGWPSKEFIQNKTVLPRKKPRFFAI